MNTLLISIIIILILIMIIIIIYYFIQSNFLNKPVNVNKLNQIEKNKEICNNWLNTYNIIPKKSFGKAPINIQNQWKTLSCDNIIIMTNNSMINDITQDNYTKFIGIWTEYPNYNGNYISITRTQDKDKVMVNPYNIIPNNFNWGKIEGTDTEEIKNKKKLITKPQYQGMCGDCWAISTTTSMSDNYVISGILDFNPNLSYTWALSCYPQNDCNINNEEKCENNACDGGDPSILIKDIANEGITSSHCIDYSWCDNNIDCNRDNGTNIDLNKLIPNCGCIKSEIEHSLYKVNSEIESISIISNDMKDILLTTMIIQNHIYNQGPVISGFLIINNFIDGKFTSNKTTRGIYIEHYDYNKDKFYELNVWNSFIDDVANECFPIDGKENRVLPSQNELEFIGAHAISIVGWGIEKELFSRQDNTLEDVPYWVARNSWGEKWGDNGYFKIAMYPINQFSQFDKDLNKQGGCILFKVDNLPSKIQTKQIENRFMSNLSKPIGYYNIDPTNNIEQKMMNISITENIMNIYVILNKYKIPISIILIIVIILILIKKRK
jgi:hypothetical protein